MRTIRNAPPRAARWMPGRAALVCLALAWTVNAAIAERAAGQAQGSIAGKVVDAATGEPVTNSEIGIRGAGVVAATNPSGWFLIPAVRPGSHVLEVRRIGYRAVTRTVELAQDDVLMLDIAMIPEPVNLPGATGVGRAGTLSAVDVQVVEIDESLATGETAEALLRRVLGAQVFAGSGEPGAQASIRLRGATSISGSQEPLIVIDGIVARGGLSGVQAADIARIEVLRGAAAASLYGSRGQAGVIEITTRRGRN